jgi:hypothetical protein
MAPSGGRRENFWGISCEKSRFYAKKIIFLPILGGGARAGCAPPLNPPLITTHKILLAQKIEQHTPSNELLSRKTTEFFDEGKQIPPYE